MVNINKQLYKPQKILVVDDDKSVITNFQEYFALKKHQVMVCDDGEKALDLLEEQEFDIVLLDLKMDRFSGFDIIETLESKGLLKDKKIALVSGIDISPEQKNKLLNKNGIIAYLNKGDKITEFVKSLCI